MSEVFLPQEVIRKTISNFGVIFIFLPLLFLLNINVPATVDEISSIVLYASNWKTLAYRDWPNNHFITTVLGYLFSNAFFYEVFIFRIVNIVFTIIYLSFLYFFLKKGDRENLYFIIVTLLMTSETFYLYSILYRGYCLQSLLCSAGIAASFIYVRSNSINLLRASNIIFAISFLHIPTTIYLWVPSVLTVTCLCNSAKQIRTQLRSFILPATIVILFELVFIVVTGYGDLRPKNASVTHLIEVIRAEGGADILVRGFNLLFRHDAFNSPDAQNYYLHIKSLWIANPTVPPLLLFTCFVIPSICFRIGIIEKKVKTFIQVFALITMFTHLVVMQTPPARVYVVYVCTYLLMIAYLSEKVITHFLSRCKLRRINYLVPASCLLLIFSVHWNFRNNDLIIPMNFDGVIERTIKENFDKKIDGTGIIKQYIAFFVQVRDKERWTLYQTRNFTRERLLMEADIYLLDKRLIEESWVKDLQETYSDRKLTVYQR